jgi:LacI family transcriptional regulator
MITIKELANVCGVSRGTIDRVLNNRGNVKPEKRALVLNMMKKLNYTPNPAGKALASHRNHPSVGILIPAEGIRFFDAVMDAMKKAEKKYELFGLKVIWRNMHGYDVNMQCNIIDELKDKVHALIITPINDPKVIEKINEFIADGIFVVTLNNDVEHSDHHCYVGSDDLNGGQTAGALLKMIGPEKLRIGILLGSLKVLGHQQRLEGFKLIMNDDPQCNVIDIKENNDDDILSYNTTKDMLEEHPEINALFVISSGGNYGACRAVLSLYKEKDLTIIVFDTIPTTIEMMKNHIIKAAIYQHPRQQGQRAMQIVFDYLINGIRPERDRYIMKNEIRILQNL